MNALYTGPMAKAGDAKQIASPLEGTVAKLSVQKGDKVREGDTFCVLASCRHKGGAMDIWARVGTCTGTDQAPMATSMLAL